MRILITGASGFVASHLLTELEPTRHTVILTSRRPFQTTFRRRPIHSLRCDLTRPTEVHRMIKRARPEALVHLAALPHVGKSWKYPSALVKANVTSTQNLCQALEGRALHFLFVSSAMVYGNSAAALARLDESSPMNPISPYGASKRAAETLVRSFETEKFRVTIVRPFNHTGPGQSLDYVCPAFAHRIRETPSGGTISVGDLRARRDFTDVRDVVRAYRLILEKRASGKTFVLGSGRAVSIKKILETMIQISGKKIQTKRDANLLQKNDLKTLVANPRRLQTSVRWRPRIPLRQTLTDLYRSGRSAK